MPALTTQPTNPNFLSQLNWRFVLKRAPNLSYFGVETELPGIELDSAEQVTPFINMKWPGNKIRYDDWEYTFKVDEDMANYLEVYDWMNNLGFPDDFTGYPKLQSGDGVVSDGTLFSLSSKQNANIQFRFINMFPYRLSPLRFSSQDADTEFLECTVSFKYQRFYIEKLA